MSKTPPGPAGFPIVGSTLGYLSDPLGFFMGLARDYGDIVSVNMGGLSIYVCFHPNDVAHILRSHAQQFHKDRFTRDLGSLIGNGLIISEGDFWRRQRKLMTPAFQLSALERYGPTMVDFTTKAMAGWQDGAAVKVDKAMSGLTLAIIAKLMFDSDVAEEVKIVDQALATGTEYFISPLAMLPSILRKPFPLEWRYQESVKTLYGLIESIIQKRRASNRDHGDLLQNLLKARDDDGSGMTDQQMRDEILTFLLAGHETTALSLSYCFHMLSRHPEIEQRLIQEIDTVLGGRPATPADVDNLPYLHNVMLESMRLYPPVWSIGREAIEDCEVGGYPIPKGQQIFMVQWVTHRDKRWFDDPLEFRPERWDNDLEKKLPRCAYFPFGDGPRICIGNHFAKLELTMILATILQKYRLEAKPGFELELLPSITVRPKHGLDMIVRAR